MTCCSYCCLTTLGLSFLKFKHLIKTIIHGFDVRINFWRFATVWTLKLDYIIWCNTKPSHDIKSVFLPVHWLWLLFITSTSAFNAVRWNISIIWFIITVAREMRGYIFILPATLMYARLHFTKTSRHIWPVVLQIKQYSGLCFKNRTCRGLKMLTWGWPAPGVWSSLHPPADASESPPLLELRLTTSAPSVPSTARRQNEY